MVTTDAQVRKLMSELSKDGRIGRAALRSGMHRSTARRYRKLGKAPSELKRLRSWRTRPDPFAEDWAELVGRLGDAPELEAKALFEDLRERRSGRYDPGQVRTLQRRVRQWRAREGPEKEVFFPQEHRPGEAMQTDFTWATELGVTVRGEQFEHMLCHPVLPYSNWEWLTVCQSESLAALRRGVQAALFRLGRVPEWHQTDNSTAATHDLRTGKRGFNSEYLAMMRHFGMEPRTIEVGKSHQNGDVEALNGAAKRRLKQHLLLRGSRDFGSEEEYEGWLQGVAEKANGLRTKRVEKELEAMRALSVARLPEFVEVQVGVSKWSTVNVLRNVYSVPSRLIHERVIVRVYEQWLEVYHGSAHQLTVQRLHGEVKHHIDYRHVIWSLVRKSEAFRQYKYREAMFPSLVFRRTYDALLAACGERKADMEYLRVLHLAASTMETEVEAALEVLLEQGLAPRADHVKELVSPARPEVPAVAVAEVSLGEYDDLLEHRMEVAG